MDASPDIILLETGCVIRIEATKIKSRPKMTEAIIILFNQEQNRHHDLAYDHEDADIYFG